MEGVLTIYMYHNQILRWYDREVIPVKKVDGFLDRWKNDYDFKTVTAASISLAVTIAFAIHNGVLGVLHSSLWHGSICTYYIFLVILRTIIISSSVKGNLQKRVFVFSSNLLLFLNICLVVPVSLMVVQQKPVNMTLVPAIAMAIYTTYKIIMASANLRKMKKTSNSFVHLLRTISFIEALVAILTLQNTLIMVNIKGESPEMLTLSAITSAAIMLIVLGLSVATMINGIRRFDKSDGKC